MAKSCMRCALYINCRESQKGPRFSCGNYTQLREIGSIVEINTIRMTPEGEDESLIRRGRKLERRKSTAGPSFHDVLEVDVSGNSLTREVEEISDTGPRASSSGPVSHSKTETSLFEVPGGEEVPDDFVWRAMQEAFDPNTNTVRDLRVDDRDLVLSDSYYHFCESVAGQSIKMPFARQLWVSLHLFGEYCPKCTSDKFQNVENIPVDMEPADLRKRVQLLENGVCPRCNSTRSGMILGRELPDFNQLVMVVGQRGGKSSLTATIAAYHVHRMLKAPRLSSICRGIQEFTPLTYTFVALTATRAIKLLWTPVHEIISHSSWFDDYFKMLDEHGRQYSKEFYKAGDLFIKFFHRNIEMYSSGPLKRTLRGDTRVLSAVDELGWFPFKVVLQQEEEEEDDERERANGDEVHTALDNSLSTVRAEVHNLYKKGINTVPTAMNLCISSPQSWSDKICRLLAESEDPDALSLGVRLPTWGINPMFTRDHPVIRAAYAKNARRAERDFGANPPKLAGNVFMKEKLLPLFHGRQHHGIMYDHSKLDRTSGRVVDLIIRRRWPPMTLGLDAGVSNNSFAMALGHRVAERVEVMTAIEVIPAPNTEIDFNAIYEFIIKPIILGCNVVCVGADHWNSIQFLQKIEDDSKKKAKTWQKTLNTQHFNQFTALCNSGNVTLPELDMDPDQIELVRNYKRDLHGKPAEHLYLQFRTVREMQGVLMKGDGYTDDLFRAVVMMSTLCFDSAAQKHAEKYPDVESENVTERSTVIVSGRSAIYLGGAMRM